MGILIRQNDMNWIIEIRETWKTSLREDFDTLVSFLLKHGIEFKVSYEIKENTTHYICHFDNVKHQNLRLDSIKTIVSTLLEYKNLFVKRHVRKMYCDKCQAPVEREKYFDKFACEHCGTILTGGGLN